MFKEFKEFISKGNVIELAVGLIMATYFGAIVKSLVDDIIMPPIGLALGGVNFADLKIVLKEAVPVVTDGETVVKEAVKEVAIMYGAFINTVLTFLIVAFAVFVIVKFYNRFRRQEEAKPSPSTPPPPSKQIELLIQIRDVLKNSK